MKNRRAGLLPAGRWGGYFMLSCMVGVHAFTSSSSKARAGLYMSSDPGFFDNIPNLPNPFAMGDGQDFTPEPSFGETEPFEATPESLLAKAKIVIATDLGVQDANLLGDDFLWIGPLLEKALGKVDYVAAGKFFNIRSAFPDFDYRAHDFRIDENDPLTVRCTVRPLGSMRGPLRLRNEIVEPNGQQWRGPPEAVSMTFDEDSGKLVKLCSGFTLDRMVGNTNGLCGVMAAATVAGVPPSDWEVYPISSVISRFFGRPADSIQEVSTFLAPFPETVMIQLVKGILATNLAAEDPSLLSKDFSFVTPSLGPVGSQKFLESYAAQEFGGFEPEFSHFRVDPFDPYRVWVDVKPFGPGLEGPPQAFSFTFDDDGFCTRMTTGAAMDPSIGNTGGLTGPDGLSYALGKGAADFSTRPLPLAIGRLKKTILSPITKIGADDYFPDVSFNAAEPILSTPAAEDLAPAVKDDATKEKILAQARARIIEEEARKKEADKEKEERLRLQKAARLAPPPASKVAAKSDSRPKQASTKKQSFFMDSDAKALAAAAKRKEAEAAKVRAAENKRIEEERKELARRKEEEKRKVAQVTQMAADQKLAEQKKNAAEAEARRKELEEKKKELARRQEEEKRKVAQAAQIAADQKAEAQKRDAAEAEARRRELERKKMAAEVQRRKDAEARAATEAEARKKQAEAIRAAAEKKRLETEAKKIAAEEARLKKAEEMRADFEKKQQEAAAKREAAQSVRQTGGNSFTFPQLNLGPPDSKIPPKASQPRPAPKKVPAPASAPRPSISLFNLAPPKVAPKAPAPAPPAKKPPSPKGLPTLSLFNQAPSKPKAVTDAPKPFFAGKKAPATKPQVVEKAPPSKSRPSLSLFPATKPQVVEKTPPSKGRPSISLFPTTKPQVVEKAPASKGRPSISLSPTTKPQVVEKAPPSKDRPSISLFNLGGEPSASEKAKVNVKAPKGVPTIAGWRQRPNGGISGKVFGSVNFKDGERVETTTIAKGDIADGNVVTTESGSRYFLTEKTVKEMGAGSVGSALTSKDFQKAKPRSTLQLTKQAREQSGKAAKANLEAAEKGAAPRATFSLSALFGLDKKDETRQSSAPPAKTGRTPAAAKAPRGVPSIGRWKQNRDKSITGIITGSPQFNDGDKITTSPIGKGAIEAGSMVVTSSGTRYFLL